MVLSAANGGEIPLLAHGSVGPVTLSLQAQSPYSSLFELVPNYQPDYSGRSAAPAAGFLFISRILRVKGPVPVVTPLGQPTVVLVAVTVRDGAGRTAVRSFQVQLR